jgi:steroid 5-alpha reductase family enzyme
MILSIMSSASQGLGGVMTPILGLVVAGFGLLVVLWVIQLRTKDAATADFGWSLLVAGGAVAAGFLTEADVWRRVLVAGLAATWALRLAWFLLVDRVLAGRGEDGRYRALREHWGAHAARNFLFLYVGQVVVAALFITPIAAAMRGGPLDGWAVGGIAVWLAAVVGETIADRQLARFRADPATRGTVCREGLWRYSRHPNYFFEWVHWWAYVLIGHAAPLTFLGPIFMLLFLFRVTGIPWTERQALKRRGDQYREYQRTTSAFVPWPPRRTGT